MPPALREDPAPRLKAGHLVPDFLRQLHAATRRASPLTAGRLRLGGEVISDHLLAGRVSLLEVDPVDLGEDRRLGADAVLGHGRVHRADLDARVAVEALA